MLKPYMKKIALALLLLFNICYAQLICTNWLNTPDKLTGVTVGALDVTGDQLTVEATCNASDIYALSRALVSKHRDPSDVNYFLCPDLAQITTSNGFFSAFSPCSFVSNKTYHVAMVYNGSSLKLYRNGFLMADVPASGTLATNAWPATIGEYAYALLSNDMSISNIFKGHINEVRIWNVARTQQQIRNYMNLPLPAPATQPGLQAYYTFEDLNNKQGNTAFNGALQGGATMNNSNPNCNFVADSCATVITSTCNNWLHIPNSQSYVTVGEIDIPGTQITVEGVFRRDSALTPEGFTSLNIVSKHWTPADVNYLLRVDRAQVTTTNGHFQTPDICELKNKKIYHAAMTYDGSTLKFYRNGFLMSQIPCTGNMFQNDYLTTIAATANSPTSNTQLIGYLNEIRIWNVAKTQAELQQYVGSSLPNPSTQPGLLAYYTFDNLNNKQGNAALDGTLHGAATINNTVPDCNFIADSCNTVVSQSCKGALELHGEDAVTLPGPESIYYPPNGFSWECWFNSSWYSNDPVIGLGHSLLMTGDEIPCEDIQIGFGWRNIAKNLLCFAVDGPGACNNYDLNPCSYQPPGGFLPNTWYHVAGVKNYTNNQTQLYVNGQIVDTKFNDKQPFTRDILSFIGRYPMRTDSGFLGKVDEIRYWDYPRSANEILSDYNKCLTGNENGLVAYFRANESNGTVAKDATSFQRNGILEPGVLWNNTINAPLRNNCYSPTSSVQNITICQGQIYEGYNSSGNYIDTFPGSNGCDSIRALNLRINNCSTGISGIINNYAAVSSVDFCNNKITVDDATAFNTGDTIVIMQMKGAAIDSSNTNNFGFITNYNNAGKYEFNYIKSKAGNTIEIANSMLNQYDATHGRVQLIRVPYFQSVVVSNTLTCPAWDGAKGGVLILNSATDINLNAGIDVSNKGFRGGAVGGGFSCGNISAWAAPTGTGGTKGEGIADYILNFEAGGANLANGGGGAYAANSGGGGGANFGSGGLGGFHSNTCPSPTQTTNGFPLDYSNNKVVFLGGGGGGGQQDNNQPVAAGGNGGGIVIIKSQSISGNNQLISSNGESIGTLVRDEGGAGGGAGGSVLLFVNTFTSLLQIAVEGGDGSSNENQIYPARCHGPGGGGGGGYVGFSVPWTTNVSIYPNGGRAGIVLNPASACFNTTGGATDGFSAGSSFPVVLPEATIPFKKNIDSVRISSNLTTCKTFALNGIAFTNTDPVNNWQWSFGDGGSDALQNTTHTYAGNGSYTVKLIAADINGCKDSISKTVTTSGINFDFVFEQDACNPRSVIYKAVGDTTAEIFWSLGDGTVINNLRNPVHIYADTGYYFVQYSTGNTTTGCIDTVRKSIYIGWRNANIILTPDTTICYGTSKLLRSNMDSTWPFCWSPHSFLNNENLANPTTSTASTITYTLLAKSEENNLVTNGNFSNGNTGFITDYLFTGSGAGLLAPGEYAINTSTSNAGLGAADCRDHTTATGNMLTGVSDATNNIIWQQPVNIVPNTNYIFSLWVQAPNTLSKAMFSLLINGNTVLDSATVPAASCTWKKYTVLWNAGNNTVAQLAIADQTPPTTITGFDNFAIDDISFATYSIKQDTVKITVDTPFINTRADTSVCETVPVTLTTIGTGSYSWSPATGLSNPSIANPVATPADTTKYVVTGTNIFGCTATDSVTIAVKPKPVVSSTGDTTICRNTAVTLFATGGGSYLWSPAAVLNNAGIATPTATATTANTKYIVTVTGTNNCISKDSFTVSVTPVPVYSVSADQSVCLNDNAPLNASGGNYYLWSPAPLVSNAAISNPVAITTNNTLYAVLVRDTVCSKDTTLTTNIFILPLPAITASKENDINCAIGSSQLTATGAQQYNWVPANTLSNAASPSPIASPINTTTYTVTGTDSSGCSNTATVTVITNYSTKVRYEVPNAFSPDGNGRNDCFQVKYFGLVTELQFAVYNRWGQQVFYTTNPNDCWDGTYKGSACSPGNFVYFIKAKTTCGAVERKGNVLLVR